MKISLPPKLKQFVEQKVNEGLYEDPSDIVSEALRALIDKQGSLIINKAYSKDEILSSLMITLLEDTKSMDDDIRKIMREASAMTANNEKLRELIKDLNAWISNEMGNDKNNSSDNDFAKVHAKSQTFSSCDEDSEATNYHARLPLPNFDTNSSKNTIKSDVYSARANNAGTIDSILDGLKENLDGMNELSEITSLRLQMIMDRCSRFSSVLSQTMKKLQEWDSLHR